MCGDGKTEREVRREHRQEGTRGEQLRGSWRTDGSKKRLEGKVMSTCVKLACLYGTETLALTERNTTAKAAIVQKQLGKR